MTFLKYLTTKIFWINLLVALVILVLLVFALMQYLNWSTNQGQKIEVPQLFKMNLDDAKTALEEKGLTLQLEDTLNFNPDFPPYSVLEYQPTAGQMVKEGRNIYVKLNPSGYRMLPVPDVINDTQREAEPKLRATGFTIGKITYKPNIAKDMVLEMRHKGEVLNPGDMLGKTEAIDLVLGNGERASQEP